MPTAQFITHYATLSRIFYAIHYTIQIRNSITQMNYANKLRSNQQSCDNENYTEIHKHYSLQLACLSPGLNIGLHTATGKVFLYVIMLIPITPLGKPSTHTATGKVFQYVIMLIPIAPLCPPSTQTTLDLNKSIQPLQNCSEIRTFN